MFLVCRFIPNNEYMLLNFRFRVKCYSSRCRVRSDGGVGEPHVLR